MTCHILLLLGASITDKNTGQSLDLFEALRLKVIFLNKSKHFVEKMLNYVKSF